MRRERGSAHGTDRKHRLPDVLAVVKAASAVIVKMTVICPGCTRPIQLNHLPADLTDDGDPVVDTADVRAALAVHLTLGCRG